jgi:glutaredoxin 3
MRCPRHDLAVGADGTCIRCRREQCAADEARLRGRRVAASLSLAFLVAGGLAWALRPRSAPPLPARAQATAYAAPSAPPLAALDPATVSAEPPGATAPSAARTPLERAMHAVQIVVYSRPDVPECARARTWLLTRGYVFKERNVDADHDARTAWGAISPDGALPSFDVDGQAFGGFDPARLEGALEYAGARRLQR